MTEYQKEIDTSKYIATHLTTIIEKSNNILEINGYPEAYKKTKNCAKFCKNFLRGKPCKWHKKGKCKFAHNFLELDKHSQSKIFELGVQNFIYMFQERNYIFSDSFFDFVEKMKVTEKLYLQELFHVQETKTQYFDLHKHFINLQKELLFLRNVSESYTKNKLDRLNLDKKSTMIKNISKMKEMIEDTVVCNICCSSIINMEDIDKVETKETYLENSNKFITLTCGHSICNLCHFRIVSNQNSIYIKCPVCREQNELNKCKPNYTLNESIFKIKMIYNEYNNILENIDEYIMSYNKEKFYTKNVSDFMNTNLTDKHPIISLNNKTCIEINKDDPNNNSNNDTSEKLKQKEANINILKEDNKNKKINNVHENTYITINAKSFECPF